MTLGAARLCPGPDGWRIDRQPGPDLAAHLRGRPPAEVATILPRLFNLCRAAQGAAAQLAIGLPPGDDDTATEVIREHTARLFVILRRAFGLAPLTPPASAIAAFGPAGPIPCDLASLQDWLSRDCPLAELGRKVRSAFPAPLGVIPALRGPGPHPDAVENSPAQRQADRPLMRALAATEGRGPLWRYLGLVIDLRAAIGGALPPPRRLADGTAVVQASRGSYFLRISQTSGLVTGLHRITPTDHQLASGGALDQALRGLPVDRPDLAARLVALFDPCIPVTIPAEALHA